jgi:hypothetical protein
VHLPPQVAGLKLWTIDKRFAKVAREEVAIELDLDFAIQRRN